MDLIQEYQDKVSCIIQPDANNCGGLYLSSLKAAKNNQIVKELNIKSVLTVLAGTKLSYSPDQIINHLKISAYDHTSYDIINILDQTYTFIEEGNKQGNVLVHCFAGMSRSASVVMAYIMKKNNLTYKQAYQHVMKVRKILPNDGFIQQLQQYELHLKQHQVQPKL